MINDLFIMISHIQYFIITFNNNIYKKRKRLKNFYINRFKMPLINEKNCGINCENTKSIKDILQIRKNSLSRQYKKNFDKRDYDREFEEGKKTINEQKFLIKNEVCSAEKNKWDFFGIKDKESCFNDRGVKKNFEEAKIKKSNLIDLKHIPKWLE